jgi:CRP-like cAMP-binding protein/Fe-S-cluster-containing hydrogenase component 2
MQVQPSGKPLAVGLGHRSDIRPLTEEEVRFEIDMCIGCDRCMRACPVPLSSLVNIADLNRATISDEIAPHVVRFIDECVMCGSCVPVCPVDNHRDLLMLSLKQRLGISWDGQVDKNRVLSYLPPGWDSCLLVSRLREQPMFSDEKLVSENYLLHFVATSKMLTLMPGSILMNEGEYGREIYFILEGRVELSALGPDGDELPVAVLRRGEYLGEHGMLTGQQRNATARAQTATVVLEVPEQVMQRLMEVVPPVQQFFERLNLTRSIRSILSRMALFQGVASVDIRWLSEQTPAHRYERDERLFSEDARDQPARESLHILLDGFVKVARHTEAGTGRDKTDERIIAYRQGGDYFAGGLDMLGDRRAVTVTAITRTTVAEMPRQALLALFSRYPEVKQRFYERLQLYREATAAAYSAVFEPFDIARSPEEINQISDVEARAGLHSLVGAGVVEGTDVLVIDLDKCIHCNECEEACERRHGHSRMNRKGMVVGNISIATACRQCQDPVCMLCSRAGIARLPSGEVYITESCIGCGICAERCPYDNISIMTLEEDEEVGRSTWEDFASFFKKGAGKERGRKMLPMAAAPGPLNERPLPDAFGELRKKLAIKCDLCAGYNNQACVQACPTGAAIRVNPTAFFGSTEEILRKRAK